MAMVRSRLHSWAGRSFSANFVSRGSFGDSSAGGASLIIAVGKCTLPLGGDGSGVSGRGDCIDTSKPSGPVMGILFVGGLGAGGVGIAVSALSGTGPGGPRAEKDCGMG